ncbi:hypothetical protein PSCICN_21260 [Pseudomonas cichorii]|uniref:hypothetical protein n=1 Tax=Pseudomonas cichorii TaxID=36746 RepID=UPI0013A08B63|nr:hypothetical protein [Pseudomonas cichorii]QIB07419.1 hypothetical protein GZ982_22680 [Pseudomonas fluorescens]GFM81434.1 hypothetical protein PSCICN_21260 [Pseudomonas cichorii]
MEYRFLVPRAEAMLTVGQVGDQSLADAVALHGVTKEPDDLYPVVAGCTPFASTLGLLYSKV